MDLGQPQLFSLLDADGGDRNCNGQYSERPGRGFEGHLTIPDYRISADGGFLSVPPYLHTKFWKVRREGGGYATVCFPRVTRRTWHGPGAMTVRFTFAYLVEDVGVEYEEKAVFGFTVRSPIIASMMALQLVSHQYTYGDATGSVTFALASPVRHVGSDLTLEISAMNWPTADRDMNEVTFRSTAQVRVTYNAPTTVSDALDDVRRFDDFVSLFAGRYVQLSDLSLEVEVKTDDGLAPKPFRLRGHAGGPELVDRVGLRDMFACIDEQDNWASTFERFKEHHAEHRIAFKWFRTSQVNPRYVEEHFLYAARLVEKYFKGRSVTDEHAKYMVLALLQRTEGIAGAEEFILKRIHPIVTSRPSLVATLRDVYCRFPELSAFRAVSATRAAELRNRETHGTDANHSAEDYDDMVSLAKAFLAAFRIAVLECCGLSRGELLERLRKTSHHHLLLDAEVP